MTDYERVFPFLPAIVDLEAELRKFLFPGSRIERSWVVDRWGAGEYLDHVAQDYGLDPAMVRRELGQPADHNSPGEDA